ncbi:MAG: DUF992 domain-containing protein [Hyphomicrobiaceae bacterium]
MRMVGVLAGGAAIALACMSGKPSSSLAEGNYPGTLQVVGALHCRAALDNSQPRLERTMLNCQYRQNNHSQKPVQLSGVLVGSGLWQVDPGVVRLMWNVLAPTDSVRPTDIAGDYDIAPSYAYKLAEKRDNILYGGLGDTFALELASGTLKVPASTRLTLRLTGGTGSAPSKG